MKYEQKFSFDTIGNMTHKKSSEIITPAMQKKDGDDLNYDLTYEYDANYAHRLTRGEEQRGRITNRLRYIGEGGTKGKARYVFLKDERDGRMYRLPFKNIGESGDGCIDENGLLEVHLGGEIYEVRK